MTASGQRLFYDAAYGQDTDQHILGLFSVGAQAEAYQAQSDDEFLEGVLAELDEVFNGAASRFYVRHVVQNWNDEPFAGAAYLEDDAPPRISASVARPVSDRVQFAGDAYTEFAGLELGPRGDSICGRHRPADAHLKPTAGQHGVSSDRLGCPSSARAKRQQ